MTGGPVVQPPYVLSGVHVSPPIRTGWSVTVSADGGRPSGGAGGVLSGQYPNPGFAQNMTTQTEHDAHVRSPAPHPAYDDLPSLRLLFENGLV